MLSWRPGRSSCGRISRVGRGVSGPVSMPTRLENPAVTITVAVFRGFSWAKVAPYIVAQVAGAFLGAAIVFWNYLPAFFKVDQQLSHTAGVFTTFPAFPAVPMAGFLDQTIGTALLLLMIFAVTDDRNQAPTGNMAPLVIGLIVVAIGISFGGMHGYAINPARDFGPRLFTVVAGFSLTQYRPIRS